jgi:hypothetical protein
MGNERGEVSRLGLGMFTQWVVQGWMGYLVDGAIRNEWHLCATCLFTERASIKNIK